jgi:hypothetical protein
MHTPKTPLRALAVTAASAGLLLTGGLAAANAGVLPDAAQDTAQEMLDKVGVQVPGVDEHAAGHAESRGRSADAPPAAGNTEVPGANHGQMISDLARSTDLEGAEKGKAISAAARTNGQAGQHGPAQLPEQSSDAGAAQAPTTAPTDADGAQSGDHARVETPNSGGTTTADDASADDGGAASSDGTTTADGASGGRSAAGSDNRP